MVEVAVGAWGNADVAVESATKRDRIGGAGNVDANVAIDQCQTDAEVRALDRLTDDRDLQPLTVLRLASLVVVVVPGVLCKIGRLGFELWIAVVPNEHAAGDAALRGVEELPEQVLDRTK